VAGVYYRPPDQRKPIDKSFLLQLKEALHSQSLTLLGEFDNPDICCKSGTASCKQSRRLLVRDKDNFLIQVIYTLTRGKVLLTFAYQHR